MVQVQVQEALNKSDFEPAANLLAAQDTESQHSESSGVSAAAGIAASYSTNGGGAIGYTASASLSKGSEDGAGTTRVNSHVGAGNTLSITSGGDTNILGAVASGKQVIADIGGDVNLASLQDKATFDSKYQSVSVSATIGYGANISASANQSKISSDYASVQEQSGIQAGDGGFQIKVAGNTDLKGAVISSTDAGIANNSLSTGTLTLSDIENHSDASADSMGLSGSTNVQGLYEASKAVAANLLNNGSASQSTAATTTSAISAGVVTITDEAKQLALTGTDVTATLAELNRDTGNTNTALEQHDYQQLLKDAEVKQAFAVAAFAEVANHMDKARDAMFTLDNKFYRVTCDGAPNDCLNNPDSVKYTEISKEEAKAEGAVLAVNGIFNDANRAAQLAYQNVSMDDVGSKPDSIVLMHIPEAASSLAELMVAGYEKLLAPLFGYTISDLTYADLLIGRDELATLSLGHSRGTIVQYNAFNILAGLGYANENLTAEGVGGAVLASSYYDAAVSVTGVPMNGAKTISFVCGKNDPVSVFAGFNFGNLVTSLISIPDMYLHNNSPHSCYGTGAEGCITIPKPVLTGPSPKNQNIDNIVTYINGAILNGK